MKTQTNLALLIAAVHLIGGLVACSDDPASPHRVEPIPLSDAGDVTSDDDGGILISGETVAHCTDDDSCDDGLECTVDRCEHVEGMGKICRWQLAQATCLIGNTCATEGEADPHDPCSRCYARFPFEWTPKADGTGCHDDDICTENTTCEGGHCVGGAQIGCDDGNVCTADWCDPVEGCGHTPVADGDPCDDQASCTSDDVCVDGACIGSPEVCDDGDPCTVEVCEEGRGCVSSSIADGGACDDDDPCTDDTVCTSGQCGGGSEASCDDGNECTVDACDRVAGCQHIPTFNPCCTGAVSVCDDHDPCTTDRCDPDTAECSYLFNTEACDDGDACTADDICAEGSCAGLAVDCDDGNDCTLDTCNVTAGCQFSAIDGGDCDDGLACSTGDACVAGLCTADTSECFCTPTFDDAAKFVALSIGANTSETDALDIDGDGERDNSLGALGAFLNEPLQAAVDDGTLTLVFEFTGLSVAPTFNLSLYEGDLAPTNPTCDYQNATCDYWTERSFLDPDTCAPVILVPGTLSGSHVHAGGVDTSLPLPLPLTADTSLDLTLYQLVLEMDVTIGGDGVVAFEGLLAGAVPEAQLVDAVLALDPASLPMPPDQLLGLLDVLAPNDIDTDGDGVDDAKSITLKITGIDGMLTGVLR